MIQYFVHIKRFFKHEKGFWNRYSALIMTLIVNYPFFIQIMNYYIFDVVLIKIYKSGQFGWHKIVIFEKIIILSKVGITVSLTLKVTTHRRDAIWFYSRAQSTNCIIALFALFLASEVTHAIPFAIIFWGINIIPLGLFVASIYLASQDNNVLDKFTVKIIEVFYSPVLVSWTRREYIVYPIIWSLGCALIQIMWNLSIVISMIFFKSTHWINTHKVYFETQYCKNAPYFHVNKFEWQDWIMFFAIVFI